MTFKFPAGCAALFTRRMLICVFTGFASGLPLYLILTLLPAWLRTEGVNLKTIGLFALIQFPYTWKFLWSPLLDRYALLPIGRRRSWMLVTQLILLAAIASLGFNSPREQIGNIVILATLIAFFSATQDIALDAFRRELLSDDEQGPGNAMHVNAYRIAGLVPGSLSLILADHLPWWLVFVVTALFMLPSVFMSLLVHEPEIKNPPRTLRAAVVEPFKEFITRSGWRSALLVLSFIFLYKLGDSMCTAMSTTFYLDMGYSKSQIGLVAKHASLWPALAGGFLGGVWIVRIGLNRALWLFGLVQLLSIFGFAWLAWLGPQTLIDSAQLLALGLVIGFEAVGVGLGTVSLLAYIAKHTNAAYSATQFALFTSLSAVPRTFFSAATGSLIEWMGWLDFFFLCAALGVPGMLLLFRVAPWHDAG